MANIQFPTPCMMSRQEINTITTSLQKKSYHSYTG